MTRTLSATDKIIQIAITEKAYGDWSYECYLPGHKYWKQYLKSAQKFLPPINKHYVLDRVGYQVKDHACTTTYTWRKDEY